MSTEHRVKAASYGQVEPPAQSSLIITDKHAVETPPLVTRRQVYALMAYYVALLVVCIALIVFLVARDGVLLDAPKDASVPGDSRRVLAAIAFLVLGFETKGVSIEEIDSRLSDTRGETRAAKAFAG